MELSPECPLLVTSPPLPHLHFVHPSPSATHRCLSSAVPASCRNSMASLVSRGITTLRARSGLPDAWITWGEEHKRQSLFITERSDSNSRRLTIFRGAKRKWTKSMALGFWMWSFSFAWGSEQKKTRVDVRSVKATPAALQTSDLNTELNSPPAGWRRVWTSAGSRWTRPQWEVWSAE